MDDIWEKDNQIAELKRQLKELNRMYHLRIQACDNLASQLAATRKDNERLRFSLYNYAPAKSASHTTACSIWREDGNGHAEGFEGDRGPCNCGALEYFSQTMRYAAEAQLAAMRETLQAHEFHAGYCVAGCSSYPTGKHADKCWLGKLLANSSTAAEQNAYEQHGHLPKCSYWKDDETCNCAWQGYPKEAGELGKQRQRERDAKVLTNLAARTSIYSQITIDAAIYPLREWLCKEANAIAAGKDTSDNNK